MNPAERERLRLSLLQTLDAVAGASLPIDTLLLGVKIAGFRSATAEIVNAELSYLQDKTLVAPGDKAVSPEMREWRITATGRDHLATRGI